MKGNTPAIRRISCGRFRPGLQTAGQRWVILVPRHGHPRLVARKKHPLLLPLPDQIFTIAQRWKGVGNPRQIGQGRSSVGGVDPHPRTVDGWHVSLTGSREPGLPCSQRASSRTCRPGWHASGSVECLGLSTIGGRSRNTRKRGLRLVVLHSLEKCRRQSLGDSGVVYRLALLDMVCEVQDAQEGNPRRGSGH
jgi:hypothetical protein